MCTNGTTEKSQVTKILRITKMCPADGFLCPLVLVSQAILPPNFVWELWAQAICLNCHHHHATAAVAYPAAPNPCLLIPATLFPYQAGAAAAQTTAAKAPPADLLFIHTGHQSPITDLSWNLSNGAEWVIASASDNNLLHIWRMRDRLYRQWTGAEGPVSEGLQDETMQA